MFTFKDLDLPYPASWAFCPLHYNARATDVATIFVSHGILQHKNTWISPHRMSQRLCSVLLQTAIHFQQIKTIKIT